MDFHLVSHTHWDREWYRTAEVFRQRLADLVDELIAAPPADGEAFLLDGQAIVLEDYLSVRPEMRDRLRSLLHAGRLEAGPWYVLADSLIPGGEALVRNLLVGRNVLASLGATSPPVLYCPDTFGHPAALPEIANGFALPLIMIWRGYGGSRWPAGDVVRWRAPSGKESLVFHLPPDGYEFGSSLPVAGDAAASRWAHLREVLATRSTLGVTLIQNGADHHARQRQLADATAELAKLATASGDKLTVSSLRAFAEALVQRGAPQRLQSIHGELRDSYGYTWTLQGTFGTRASQKRANAIAERTLLRAERWSGAVRLAGGGSRSDHLRAAWKTLLEAHPHDTLCGTSIDEVADAMDVRVRAARRQAQSVTNGAIAALLGHDPAAGRDAGDRARDLLVISNGVPSERGGVVMVEQVEKLADEPVGPGSANGPRLAEVRARQSRSSKVSAGAQLIESRIGRNRVESPRHYPDNDIVSARLIACYVDPQPGMSVRVIDDLASRAPASPASIETADAVAGLVRFEDRADRGDLYTPSVGEVVALPRMTRKEQSHRGPLVAELRHEWSMIPEHGKTSAGTATMSVAIRAVADSPVTELRVRGVNRARNHRLRIGIATGLAGAAVYADAAFGPVERKPITVSDEDLRMEMPPATAPLHRYVSLFTPAGGMTIHSDGLAEYEVDGDGTVWITLVRAVGQLSRNDLPERPGHAGWPEPTPGAQSLGRFAARFAVQPHGAMTPAVIHAIDRESDRFLNPLRGFTVRASIASVRHAGGIELSGVALSASAIKESEDGRSVVLRCVNLSDREQHGAWSIAGEVDSTHLARLDETALQPIEMQERDGRRVIPFTAGPRAVVTILATIPRRSGAFAQADR